MNNVMEKICKNCKHICYGYNTTSCSLDDYNYTSEDYQACNWYVEKEEVDNSEYILNKVCNIIQDFDEIDDSIKRRLIEQIMAI